MKHKKATGGYSKIKSLKVKDKKILKAAREKVKLKSINKDQVLAKIWRNDFRLLLVEYKELSAGCTVV